MKKYIDKTKTIDGEEFDLHDSRLIDAVPEGKFLSDDFTWKTIEMPIVTQVIPNPPLEGDEDNLTGLQVGEVKYKIKDVRLPEPNEEGKILQVGENGYELNDIPEGVAIIKLNSDSGYLTDEEFELAKKPSTLIWKISGEDPTSPPYFDYVFRFFNTFYNGEHYLEYVWFYSAIQSSNSYLNERTSSCRIYFDKRYQFINNERSVLSVSGTQGKLTSLNLNGNKYTIPSGGMTVVELTGYSGTLTVEQKTALEGNNAIIKWNHNSTTHYLYKYQHSYPMSENNTIYYVAPYVDLGSNLSCSNYITLAYGTSLSWSGTYDVLTEYKIRKINPSTTDSSPNLTSLNLNGTIYKIGTSTSSLKAYVHKVYITGEDSFVSFTTTNQADIEFTGDSSTGLRINGKTVDKFFEGCLRIWVRARGWEGPYSGFSYGGSLYLTNTNNQSVALANNYVWNISSQETTEAE